MFINYTVYNNDLHKIALSNIDWGMLRDKSILITGATGLIGTFLIDLLMYRNINYNDSIMIYALGRSREKAMIRFNDYFESRFFVFIQQDIQSTIKFDISVDYIIHGASNTHPIAYATDPINTILLSVLGTKSILDFASTHNVKRTLFLSTVEIYGENRGDIEFFDENYCGYIDCNTLRAGYPEGKRSAEALCQAYIEEKNIDIVIARCCRIYGPTMGDEDSKAIAQFIRNTVNKKSIILKSKGNQQYSYLYVADICSALMFLLLNGEKGEAYNVSDNNSKLSLQEIANLISEYSNTEIVYDLPSSDESSGFSKATKALLNSSKLQALGWEPKFSLRDGITRTVEILKQTTVTIAEC
jgi:nucleoside-diphosphate-sugar epimerase